MAGYAQIGRSEHVFDAYGQMLREGIRPNLVTFVVLLNACSRAHLLDRSRSYLDSMSAEHGIAPALEHQSCLLHLLGKLGLLDQARAMIRDMPFSPDVIVWHSMLRACRESRNPGLAKEAFERSVCFDIVAGC
jgi:pentatricopeptide repeat protein